MGQHRNYERRSNTPLRISAVTVERDESALILPPSPCTAPQANLVAERDLDRPQTGLSL